MPHIILAQTDNVADPRAGYKALFAELHQVLVDIFGVDIGNCKSRAIRLDNYYVGAGEPENAFVHLEVGIFEGRPTEVRREAGQHCLAVLESHFAHALERLKLQITVEIRELDRKTYLKAASG